MEATITTAATMEPQLLAIQAAKCTLAAEIERNRKVKRSNVVVILTIYYHFTPTC